LLISLTYLLRRLFKVLLLKRLFKVLKEIIIKYFKLKIFVLGYLLKIKHILIFLIVFLIRIKYRVSLYKCFYNTTNKINIKYKPFIRYLHFFKELLIVIPWVLNIIRACVIRINENISLWLIYYKG
jgi:hypothetical protein